jgi:hypothetical protein
MHRDEKHIEHNGHRRKRRFYTLGVFLVLCVLWVCHTCESGFLEIKMHEHWVVLFVFWDEGRATAMCDGAF